MASARILMGIVFVILDGTAAAGPHCIELDLLRMDRCDDVLARPTPQQHRSGFIIKAAAHGASIAPPSAKTAIVAAAEHWIAAANRARASGALIAGQPLPTALTVARAEFERTWVEAGLSARTEVGLPLLQNALSLVIRSYRLQEYGSPQQANAIRWADEMIAFFRETASRRELAEAMLEKAATYLEISQIHHTDRVRFEQIARDGAKILQDVFAVAEEDQKTEVLRFWSRFYYNLARPPSGRLSDRWNDEFLALAEVRIDGALAREPDQLRNLNQKARVVQRRARNTLDAPSQRWSLALWAAHDQLRLEWLRNETVLQRPEQRISPLNVLATITLDSVAYELAVSDTDTQRKEARRLLDTLDEVGLSAQREAWAMVKNTDLARSYGFDTAYDLARLYSLRAVLTGILRDGRQNEDFDAASEMLTAAREVATVPQLDAARASLQEDPVFVWLPDHARERFARVLAGEQ